MTPTKGALWPTFCTHRERQQTVTRHPSGSSDHFKEPGERATPRMKIAWHSLKNIGMHLNASPGARSTACISFPRATPISRMRWELPDTHQKNKGMHLNASPGARSTAPTTTSALASPKCCACHARWGPTAARATTPQPFRQLPNAAPATQTQVQAH